MSSFQQAFKDVSKLVSDFKDNESYYLSPQYQEVEARRDFIDRLFMALGWDVKHDEQKNPYEQEVKVETIVQIAHAQKRSDYSFYLAPDFHTIRFFVEAKKPSRNLANNKDDFFQTVRYGWNAGTPLAVLTDFEEFIVLDCRFQPKIDDILNAKLLVFHYSDYAKENKFRELYHLFSREAVSDDSLSKYAASLPKPRGRTVRRGLFPGSYISIDEAFLEELDDIRLALARSFKNNDNSLDSDELTEATQRTIDRLVFLRFLEDKLIEPHHYISEFGNRKSAWEDFISASRTLDAKYNGVVFKKHRIDSRNFVGPDDKTFSDICEELSHKSSPYNFDAIPIHILGSIYERFLGKVVHATAKRANIEEKPEVRKAGGVYYTPQYIVNYIVDNTVGKLIKDKTPRQISKLRFADIACGSGSFLITVFEKLLEYHKKWYQENPEQAKKDGCIFLEGAWRLTLKQKQKILTNNIYGVDLDQQAVEVTQLSLYLKLLEDETTATANDTWVMFKEQLLPDLNKNIVCGNSLIDTDILDENLFDFEEEKKINPMNFEDVFPEVMKKGGFDAIVGNPPYVLSREVMDKKIKDFYSNHYLTLWEKPNTFILFLEKAYNLINSKGYLSYIIPNSWLTIEACKLSRKLFINSKTLKILDDLNYNVFKNVGVEPLILTISKYKPSDVTKYRRIFKIDDFQGKYLSFSQESWNKEQNNYAIFLSTNPLNDIIIDKILNQASTIGDVFDVRTGLQAYEYNKGIPKQSKKDVDNHVFDYDKKFDKDTFKYLDGKNVARYTSNWSNKYLRYGKWLSQPRTIDIFSRPRILLREITGKSPHSLYATYFENSFLNNKSILNILDYDNSSTNLKFLLSQLNSKLMTFFYKARAVKSSRKLFPKVVIRDLCRFPILPLSNNQDAKKIITLVNQMLASKKQLQQAKTASAKNYLERKCERIDKEIDQLVYQLYGLTEDEINIVEVSTGSN